MIKLFIPVIVLMIALSSCNKSGDDTACPMVTTVAPASEVATLRTYLTNASITAKEDSRGFFYNISDTGSVAKPHPCSRVTVTYVGKLTNGSQFDAQNKVSFSSLSGLITGWQEAIPLIGRQGTITMYLPPSLGYGSSANGSIPANSILVFTVNLVDFE